MSGVYLPLWNPNLPLSATKGGWPHITVCYSGKNLDKNQLVDLAQEALSVFSLKTVHLNKAYVNSFMEGGTKERHDVLLSLDMEDDVLIDIESFRSMIKERHSEVGDKIYMREPHVTAKIFYDKEEARKFCEEITKILPIEMDIVGVTID